MHGRYPCRSGGTGRDERSAHPLGGSLEWQAASRLDGFTAQIRALTGSETEAIAEFQRYLQHVGPAAARLPDLLAAAAPG